MANRNVLWGIEGTLRWQRNYQALHCFVYVNNVGIMLEHSFPYFQKNHILQMYAVLTARVCDYFFQAIQCCLLSVPFTFLTMFDQKNAILWLRCTIMFNYALD